MKVWPFFDPVIDADFTSWRRSEFRRRLNEGWEEFNEATVPIPTTRMFLLA